MNKLVLELTDQERIVIESAIPLKDLPYIDYVHIIFEEGDKRYMLHIYDIGEALERFCRVMTENLQGNAVLPFAIRKQDVGYFHNRGKYGPVATRIKKADHLGSFLVWSSPCIGLYLETWLYNDAQGNIIFHVTELFRRDDIKFIKDQKVAYKEFMQNYKPTLIRVIPRSIARTWLAKCKRLLKVVEKNPCTNPCCL